MSFTTNNQRETLAVIDSVSSVPFHLKGFSSDGSLSVNITSIAGSGLTVSGNKSNNGGIAGATNLGVLPAIATVAAPTYTEGNQVGLSTDLAGNLRVTGSLSVGGTTDNSTFTAGSSTGTPALGFYHSTIDTVTDGRAATVAITNKRAMMVNLQDTAGNAITYNSTTTTGIHAPDANIGSILGTAPTTAGKLDVKGADGDVFVRQSTGSNLHTVLDSGTLTTITNAVTVSQGTAANLKVDLSGSAANTTAGLLSVKLDQSTPGTTNAISIAQIGTGTVATAATGIMKVGLTDGTGTAITSTGAAVDVNLKTSSITLNASAVGTLTNNNAVPAATNIGVLPAIASKSPQNYTDGNQVLLNTDLGGNLRTTVIGSHSVDLATIAGQPILSPLPGVLANMIVDELGQVVTTYDQRLAVHARGTQDVTENTTPSYPYFNNSLSNVVQLVRQGRTNVYYINLVNTNSSSAYVQVFDNSAVQQIVLGTTQPTEVWFVPAAGAFEETFAIPMSYMNGIYLAATTTATGLTAPTTGLIVNLRTSS